MVETLGGRLSPKKSFQDVPEDGRCEIRSNAPGGKGDAVRTRRRVVRKLEGSGDLFEGWEGGKIGIDLTVVSPSKTSCADVSRGTLPETRTEGRPLPPPPPTLT